MSSTENCPFLALPAELRLQIYEYALCPGALNLTSNKSKRYAVEPRVSPALLATCHQVHNEAQDLLYTVNAITLTIDAHETHWPPISESRLPQRSLEKLQHFCVIFDCTIIFNAGYKEVDFAAFEALVSLETLRVSMLYATEDIWGVSRDPVDRGMELLTEILMRVPRSTEVLCGFEGSQQEKVLEQVLEKRRQGRQLPDVVQIAKGDDIKAAIAQVPGHIRGTKNGQNPDVFAEYREQLTSGMSRVSMS